MSHVNGSRGGGGGQSSHPQQCMQLLWLLKCTFENRFKVCVIHPASLDHSDLDK